MRNSQTTDGPWTEVPKVVMGTCVPPLRGLRHLRCAVLREHYKRILHVGSRIEDRGSRPAGDRGSGGQTRMGSPKKNFYETPYTAPCSSLAFGGIVTGLFVLGSTLDPRIGMGRPGDRGSRGSRIAGIVATSQRLRALRVTLRVVQLFRK